MESNTTLQYPMKTNISILKILNIIPDVDKFIETISTYSTGDTCCQEYFRVKTRTRAKGKFPISLIWSNFSRIYNKNLIFLFINILTSKSKTIIIKMVRYMENVIIMHALEIPKVAHMTSTLIYSMAIQRKSKLLQLVILIFLFHIIDAICIETIIFNP